MAIFNNEFDVLADELESLTEMIALGKKESEKSMREELGKYRGEFMEEVKILVGIKAKEANAFTDKAIAKN